MFNPNKLVESYSIQRSPYYHFDFDLINNIIYNVYDILLHKNRLAKISVSLIFIPCLISMVILQSFKDAKHKIAIFYNLFQFQIFGTYGEKTALMICLRIVQCLDDRGGPPRDIFDLLLPCTEPEYGRASKGGFGIFLLLSVWEP